MDLIPERLRNKFAFDEREHAIAILAADFPEQFQDIADCLDAFWLRKSYIMEPGGGRSPISFVIDGFLSGIRQQERKATAKAKHHHAVIAADWTGGRAGLGRAALSDRNRGRWRPRADTNSQDRQL